MKIKLMVIFSIIIISLKAQVPDIIWQQCFGTSSLDYSYTISETEDGFLIGIEIDNGQNATNFHGLSDIWLIRTDSNGVLEWEKCFGGSNYDTPNKIIKLTDDSFYLFGATKSSDGDIQSLHHGESDLWVFQINGQGGLLWEKCYGSPGPDEFRDMILTPDGGFLLLSRIHTSGGDVSQYFGSWDIWMCKCDSVGNIEWEKTLGNSMLDNGISMIINSDGNIMMIGAASIQEGMVECDITGNSWTDVWLVEISLLNGEIMNQHCYGGSDSDLGYYITEIIDGYILVASTKSSDGDISGFHGLYDIWTVLINDQGSIQWQKCLGGTYYEDPVYITQVSDGGYIVIGETKSHNGDVTFNHSWTGGGWSDIWVIKLNPYGNIEWDKCYGGIENERFFGVHTVIKKSDYNYVLLAQAQMNSEDVLCNLHGNFDAWVFEIKDCSQYMPVIPETPFGPDTVCTVYGEPSILTTESAALAWDYEWALQPDSAGTIGGDSLQAEVNWNPAYEGTVAVIVRSHNDCGYSEWSQPHYVQVNSCIGTNEYATSRMMGYPNPAKDFVEFKVESFEFKVGGQISVYGVLGDEVARLEVADGRAVWDCHEAKEGVYFYRMEMDGIIVSGKFAVRK